MNKNDYLEGLFIFRKKLSRRLFFATFRVSLDGSLGDFEDYRDLMCAHSSVEKFVCLAGSVVDDLRRTITIRVDHLKIGEVVTLTVVGFFDVDDSLLVALLNSLSA
jgi:hypothetical protein